MKKLSLFLLLFIDFTLFSQNAPPAYMHFINLADSFYEINDFKNSALSYSEAFKTTGGKGSTYDKYNAACSWSLAGYPDSAFSLLERLANKSNFTNYEQISKDKDFSSLYSDVRWDNILIRIKQNKSKEEASITFNMPLKNALEKILEDDQKYRILLAPLEKKGKANSREAKILKASIKEIDSINLIKIKSIVNMYGWVGFDMVGTQAHSVIFIVTQHADADLATMERYLPLLKNLYKKVNLKEFISHILKIKLHCYMENIRFMEHK